MYCRVIGCDFDGTGAVDGRMSPEVAAALGKARAKGYTTLLVTGRVLEEIQLLCGDHALFDAIIAENGAVIWLCPSRRTIRLGVPPPEHFLGELRARNVPFHTGAVIVGTWERHAPEVLDLVRRFGIDSQIVFNRSALMLLPSGINKAVGVRRALEELGRSERNLVAFGDAENDVPLLASAEVGVAVRGSVDGLLAQADEHLSQPGATGVAEFIHRVLQQDGILASPPRRNVALGAALDGETIRIPASGTNVMVCGDPRSGKSWVAGLIAEQLIETGYRLCVLDPEGDYVSLAKRPHTVLLGHDIALPSPGALFRLFRDNPLSFVLNLSSLPLREKTSYVESALAALQAERVLTGIPHWVLIDEAHYFFVESSHLIEALRHPAGNFILVTYRPSSVASEAYAAIQAYVVTGSRVEEERYFLTKLLQARAPRTLAPHAALKEIESPRAGLLLESPSGPRWQIFMPANRITDHAHHGRKYAETLLSEDKAFRFLVTNALEPVIARSVTEFHRAVQNVPVASLQHHLLAGDFSRWFALALGDEKVARGLRKIERATPNGAIARREEVLAHIEDQYLVSNE
jgi:hydroxymethylpyrimidine pyrophosphatase-like HAD family hydrolase